MAAMKTMMEVLLDVGPTMSEKIQSAKCFIGHYFLQRMLASKTIEFGVVTYGDDKANNHLNASQGGYDNVNEAVAIGKPSDQTFAAIEQIKLGSQPGDLIDGIVVCQDNLIRVNAGKTFNRLLFIITDGESEVQGVEDLEAIVTEMKNMKLFSLYIAVIGRVYESSSTVKRENAKLLQSLVGNFKGRYMEIEALNDFIHLLSAGAGLGTKPTLTKSVLQITSELRVRVAYWGKVMKVAAPSLKKRKRADLSSDDNIDSNVGRDTSYRSAEDPERDIPVEEKVRGYKYGTQFIPIGSGEENLLTIKGEQGIQVIGVASSQSIPRQHCLEGPVFVHSAADDPSASLCLASLVEALEEQHSAFIARVTKKDDADPYLAVLFPYRLDTHSTLLLYRLPCMDDVREYNFPSLVSFANLARFDSTQKQQYQAITSLVDSAMLGDMKKESLQFSCPELHKVYHELHKRLLSQHNIVLHTANTEYDITQQLSYPREISTEKLVQVSETLLSSFKLSRVEGKEKGAKRVFWSDINLSGPGESANHSQSSNQNAAEMGLDMARIINALKREENDEGEGGHKSSESIIALPELCVGSVTPIADFQARLESIEENYIDSIGRNEEKERVVIQTFLVMTQIIERNVLVGASKAHYKRAVACLVALREACVKFDRAEYFNTYMRCTVKIKLCQGRYAQLFDLLIEEQLSLITMEESASSSVSCDEKIQFLCLENNEVLVNEILRGDVADEDDLFGDMA